MEKDLVMVKKAHSEEPSVVTGGVGNIDADLARGNVRRAAENFKQSWRSLASALTIVWQGKFYSHWGYEKFDDYTAQEVKIRKHTAMKLIRSYQFLQEEETGLIKDETEDQPSLEMVETLQKAKKALPEADYKKIKQDLVKEKRDIGEVKKDLTCLMHKQRNENGEEDRNKVNQIIVRKMLATLKDYKRDIELTKILPGVIGDDLGNIIEKIEKYFSQEQNLTSNMNSGGSNE